MFKSIKTSVIALILITTAIYAKGQKVINSGSVTYGVTYGFTEEQRKQIDESMLPKENKIDFDGNLSRLKLQLGPAMITVIDDAVAKSGLLLIDVPIAQKQYAAKRTTEYMQKERGDTKYSNFKATGVKKLIAGYNAEQYTYTDQNATAYELWTTKDVQLSAGARMPGFEEVPGTLLQFTMVQNGVPSILVVKSIKEAKVGPFSTAIPSGYEEKTMDEISAMRGAQ